MKDSLSSEEIRAWLARWRDELPIAAQVELRQLLGEFATNEEWEELTIIGIFHPVQPAIGGSNALLIEMAEGES